ncbi:MAG: sugar phosphate isomerase/epimerase family protein [Promethearchaeota archaeon]
MNLGISSLGFIIELGILNHYQDVYDLLYNSTKMCLDFADERNIDLVELVIDPPEIQQTEKRLQLIDLINSYPIKIQVHGPFIDVNLCSHNNTISKASLEIYIDTAKFCNAINAKIMTIHPGLANSSIETIQDYNKIQLKHTIEQLLNFTSNYDMIICLENMTKRSGIMLDESNIEDIISFINRDDLYLTYDTSHFYTANGNIELLWDKFHNKIKNVHLVDNFTKESDPHPTLGVGNINFQEIFNIIKGYNYEGPFIIELSSAKDLDESLNFINKFL